MDEPSLTCISKLLQFQSLAHSRARNQSRLPLLMLYCAKYLRQGALGVGLPPFLWGFPYTVSAENCLPEKEV